MTISLNPRWTIAAFAAATLAVASCSSGNATPAAQESTSSTAAEPVESDDPAPRVVVSFEDRLDVYDAATMEVVGSFPMDSAPYLSVAADGRHVFSLEHADERVRLLDAGTWSDAHGDHGHYYTADPALLGHEIDGTSFHAVNDDSRTVVWIDETGELVVFDGDDFTAEPEVIETGDAHHGVAAPSTDGGYVASVTNDTSDGDPVGVAVLDSSGTEIARDETCPELHGETHVGDALAFGCVGSILLVNGTQFSHVPAPNADIGTAMLVSDGQSPVVAASLSGDDPALATQIGLYDTAAGTSRTVPLSAEYTRIAAADGRVAAVSTDGNLQIIELATGAVRAIPAVSPWEKTDDFEDPRPQVTLAGDTAWVTDPVAGAVVTVDLAAGAVTATTEADGVPGQIVIVNAGSH